MKHNSVRHPRLGDVIVQTCVAGRGHSGCAQCDGKHVGTVIKIDDPDALAHRLVYIHWPAKKPTWYDSEKGYASLNIHNLRDEFQVFRKGTEIR